MRNDDVTFKDLSIFSTQGSSGVVGLLDYTTTALGKKVLHKHIKNPPQSYEQLQQLQNVVKYWAANTDKWPKVITNGTLVMLEKFFEAADNLTAPPSKLMAFVSEAFQKFFNKGEYFFTQFSVSHISDFLKGCSQLVAILKEEQVPIVLQEELKAIESELSHPLVLALIAVNKDTSYREQAKLSYHARRELKNRIERLMRHYTKMDAWQAMAVATIKRGWAFPDLLPAQQLCFEAKGLMHPLLTAPQPYDIRFDNAQNFLVLTGANMSGKTTFMRSIGVAALLAHAGMGVPAKSLRTSFFSGIITNMHVEDNLVKGESYFFAEVKRMKQTAEKLLRQQPHLVLMDELFKGTNVHDAYECTKAVVTGLLNRPEHLKILSTHLYEVANHFNEREDVLFSYFVTHMVEGDNFHFNYELKEGISQDRIGFKILQKEGVLQMLNADKSSRDS